MSGSVAFILPIVIFVIILLVLFWIIIHPSHIAVSSRFERGEWVLLGIVLLAAVSLGAYILVTFFQNTVH